jgi:cell division protein ZapA
MADVNLSVGGRLYRLSCHDGEEAALRAAAELLDARCRDLAAALGTVTEARLLLMAALVLAGERQESANAPPPAAAFAPELLDPLVERAEALAARLEQAANNA